MPRRIIAEIIQSVRLPYGWVDEIVDNRDVIDILAYLAEKARVSDRTLKYARLHLPDCLDDQWEKISLKLGLPGTISRALTHIRRFSPPTCMLPPSWHKQLFESGWHALNVNEEELYQQTESEKLHLLEPWLVAVFSLFQGRVFDTRHAVSFNVPGGDVAHQVTVLDCRLFIIIERIRWMAENNEARLFLELITAVEDNKWSSFPPMRVFGVLIDGSQFWFYSYDPVSNAFSKDQYLYPGKGRNRWCADMGCILSNKIFSIIMYAYVEALRTYIASFKKEAEQGHPQMLTIPHPRASRCAAIWHGWEELPPDIAEWERALSLAEDAYAKFQKVPTDISDWEVAGTEGLALLEQSVRCIPRWSRCSAEEPSSLEDLRALASKTIDDRHEGMMECLHLGKDPLQVDR